MSISTIDHVIVLVADLARAAETYRRLGFFLTKKGEHTKLGTHNHCMMFQDDYMEILGVREPGQWTERWTTTLKDREGLVGIALLTDDAAADGAALRARGIAAGDPVTFSRAVDTPEVKGDAEFIITQIPSEATPGAYMFFDQHLTRDKVWHPAWQTHANGAIGIAGATMVHPAPTAVADTYRKLVGEARVKLEGEGIAVHLGSKILRIVREKDVAGLSGGIAAQPSHTPARLVGLSLRVADPEATAAYLTKAGVAFARGPGIVVAPAHTHGVVLSFAA